MHHPRVSFYTLLTSDTMLWLQTQGHPSLQSSRHSTHAVGAAGTPFQRAAPPPLPLARHVTHPWHARSIPVTPGTLATHLHRYKALGMCQARLCGAAGCDRPATWIKPHLGSMQRGVTKRAHSPDAHGSLPPTSQLTRTGWIRRTAATLLQSLAQLGHPSIQTYTLTQGTIYAQPWTSHTAAPALPTPPGWLPQWLEEGTWPPPLAAGRHSRV